MRERFPGLKVGDMLFGRGERDHFAVDYQVAKIGRRWIEAYKISESGQQFVRPVFIDRESGTTYGDQAKQYLSHVTLYRSRAEYEERVAVTDAWQKLRWLVRWQAPSYLTLAEIEGIIRKIEGES